MYRAITNLSITNTSNPKGGKNRHWRQHQHTRISDFEIMQRQVTHDRIHICKIEKELEKYKKIDTQLKKYVTDTCNSERKLTQVNELLNLIRDLYGDDAFEIRD